MTNAVCRFHFLKWYPRDLNPNGWTHPIFSKLQILVNWFDIHSRKVLMQMWPPLVSYGVPNEKQHCYYISKQKLESSFSLYFCRTNILFCSLTRLTPALRDPLQNSETHKARLIEWLHSSDPPGPDGNWGTSLLLNDNNCLCHCCCCYCPSSLDNRLPLLQSQALILTPQSEKTKYPLFAAS